MSLKYTFVLSALWCLSACGVKSEQKVKAQSVTDVIAVSQKKSNANLTTFSNKQADTLPTYIDRYTKEDSVLVCQLLQEFVSQRQQLTNEQLIVNIGRKFIGVPYVAHTLDKNEDEKLVVNLHGLDCSTFVETVTALTLCVKKGETRFSDYVHQLEKLRYRDGKMSYVNRLHYFHWWLENNERMGFVKEIATANPPFTAFQTLKINYMSLNSALYDMLKNNSARVAEIKKLEDATNGTRLRYIPKNLLNNSKLLREVIRDGDILAIVTSKRELDTTHLGFAVWHKDGLHLMNASNLRKNGNKVVEPVESLYDYMMARSANLGIRVVRIQ